MLPVDFTAPQSNQTGVTETELTEILPTAQRFALAYAPAAVRADVLTVLALDTRLAGVVRAAREPVLAQLRLAWWREALQDAAAGTIRAEPLLGRLESWREETAALIALVDGWEAMLANDGSGTAGPLAMAEGRGNAFAALARVLQHADCAGEAQRAAIGWSLVDQAGRTRDPDHSAATLALARARVECRPRLPRVMRSLAVLHGLARRAAARRQGDLFGSSGALFAGIRLGIIGR